MPIASISGIAGGILAIAVAVWFLVMVVWQEGIGTTKFLLGFMFSIFMILMGALSLAAIGLKSRKPRLAVALIWVSIAGMFIASNLDAPALWIIVWPAIILLLPAALNIKRVL